ncbi:hypothetical protein Cs7R123_01590 [Catellatospora sp. TT07R-123]|uniref:AfsR/SARP family transcriptional regulator n=1 Tax=Catellatospora sp. TT07R-123 TaxID=2733863 RepID=UPI001B1DD884|nr:BTAD domain-containing putative transcriptional regulator [Catellatospora sp. TT07R-123]GHJ42817.1 hypothetical protein Cs7R123_01590 [Catellatospora sp. TT07R-123]
MSGRTYLRVAEADRPDGSQSPYGRCNVTPSAPALPVPALQFSVLGPMQVRHGGRDLPLGPRKQQIVLATLLCSPNRHVPTEVLAEAVWGERPPRTARKNLHVYVSTIRRQLGHAGATDRISHRHQGYVIFVEPAELDSLGFEEATRAAADLGGTDRARAGHAGLRRALDLWRGPAFEGLHTVPVIDTEAQRLSRRYVTVFETWAETALQAHPGAVVDQIEPIIQHDPYRERLRIIQMTALHRAGRRSEALAVFDDYRQAIAREFGLPPSAVMTRLQERLLLETDAPAGGRAEPGAVCSLPRDVTGFSGRDDELGTVEQLLRHRTERLAVITGSVGTGKTALAVHAAHRVRDAFGDGQLYVDTRGAHGEPRPPADLLRDLLRDAGVFVAADEPAARVQRTWQTWLARRRVLIVADDVAAEETARPLVPQSGESVLLITSRARLSGLAPAHRLVLGPLSPPAAHDMLARYLGPDRLDADRDAVVRILRATGQLPLAIAAAGSKLAGLRHLPLREFADRLAEADRTLDELQAGSLTVRPRLEAALLDLSAAQRQRFVELGRLGRPWFTLGEAAQVLGGGSRAAGLALEQLIEAGVVDAPDSEVCAHEVVYALTDLLHRYAVELAGSA